MARSITSGLTQRLPFDSPDLGFKLAMGACCRFTVKHEMVSWLEKYPEPHHGQYTIWKMMDNPWYPHATKPLDVTDDFC